MGASDDNGARLCNEALNSGVYNLSVLRPLIHTCPIPLTLLVAAFVAFYLGPRIWPTRGTKQALYPSCRLMEVSVWAPSGISNPFLEGVLSEIRSLRPPQLNPRPDAIPCNSGRFRTSAEAAS